MLIHRKGVLLDGIGSELVRVGSLIKTIRRWLELLVMGYVNVKAYGAKGDLQTFSTGAITASDQTLTVTGASFTKSDIGKKIWVQYAAGGSLPLVTTIASINSSTSVELTDAANSGVGSLTNLEIAYGTDDTTAIKAALASLPARGGEIFFPVGSYGWSDGNGIVLGDGSASAPSTVQNIDLIGEVGGTGKQLTNNLQGVEIRWFGTGTGTYMLDCKGPIRVSVEHITFEAKYRVNTIWNLKHVFNSFFHACNLNNARQKGVVQGAYPTPTGCNAGSSNNHFDQIRVDNSGQTATTGWLIGETTFTAGMDVSRNSYEHCTVLVADDSGMTWPTATANTSIAWQLSFCDNLEFHDCFAYISGQRRGFGLRVVAPTGSSPAGAYPSEIASYNCVFLGGVTVDNSGQTWVPDTNYGRGISFYGLNTGDMTDPAYSGHASIPTSPSNGGHEGFNGFTGDGVVLDRFQQQLTRAGISSYTVSAQDRDVTQATVSNSTTPTDVYSYAMPANAFKVFDRIANAYKTDRTYRLRAHLRYLNNTAGASDLSVKVYLGATTIFDSGIRSLAQSASRRTIILQTEITALDSASSQSSVTKYDIGAAGSSGTSGALNSIDVIGGNTGLTEDTSSSKTLRIEVTHGTADTNIAIDCITARLELI